MNGGVATTRPWTLPKMPARSILDDQRPAAAASLLPDRAPQMSLTRRCGLTVLELLVSLAIIGILAGLVLPAIGSVRETSRRVQCTDHLREFGLALQNHHNTDRSLPPGWAMGTSVLSPNKSTSGFVTNRLNCGDSTCPNQPTQRIN